MIIVTFEVDSFAFSVPSTHVVAGFLMPSLVWPDHKGFTTLKAVMHVFPVTNVIFESWIDCILFLLFRCLFFLLCIFLFLFCVFFFLLCVVFFLFFVLFFLLYNSGQCPFCPWISLVCDFYVSRCYWTFKLHICGHSFNRWLLRILSSSHLILLRNLITKDILYFILELIQRQIKLWFQIL